MGGWRAIVVELLHQSNSVRLLYIIRRRLVEELDLSARSFPDCFHKGPM